MEKPNSLVETDPASPRAALHSRPVLIKSGDHFSEGTLYLRDVKNTERLFHAVKIWVLMWLCAVLSIPIMVVHFVLIPGFLIAGPVLAFKRLGLTEAFHHATGTCPRCKKEFTLPQKPFGHMPLWMNCTDCKAWLCALDKKS